MITEQEQRERLKQLQIKFNARLITAKEFQDKALEYDLEYNRQRDKSDD
jgi:hypothetical protein